MGKQMINNEDQLFEIIETKKHTYIYGAGEIGKLLEKRIVKQGIKISGFCVSDVLHKKGDEITILSFKIRKTRIRLAHQFRLDQGSVIIFFRFDKYHRR